MNFIEEPDFLETLDDTEIEEINKEVEANRSKPIQNTEKDISLKRVSDDIDEINRVASVLRKCFMTGSSNFSSQDEKLGTSERFLSMDNLSGLLEFTVAYYSWSLSVWGVVRSEMENSEQTRKYGESEAFVKIKKNDRLSEGKGMTAKEIESLAVVQIKDLVVKEMEWRTAYNKINACRSAFDSFIKAIDSIKFIKNREWNANG